MMANPTWTGDHGRQSPLWTVQCPCGEFQYMLSFDLRVRCSRCRRVLLETVGELK